MTKLNKEKINKILIIKLRGIGDVVLSTIVIDNLRKDFPNAQIDYLVEAPSEPGLLGLKEINRVLIFERNDFWKKVSLIFQIRKIKYDLVFDFFTNPSTAIITFLSGAEYRAGFPYRGRRYAYNLFGPEERGKYHSAQLHLETLKLLGLNYSCKELHYFINSSALHTAEKYFNDNFIENNFVIGICPTGGWDSKKCDPYKFAEIANALINKFNAKIFIIWGKSDEDDALKIHSLLGEKSFIAPETTIQELAAMIARCKILIANDSGPMHIAAAVGTPVMGLFGPTNPYMHGPFGDKNEWIRLDDLECIECNLLVCPRKHECFRDLPVEKVLGKVELLISKNNIVIPSLDNSKSITKIEFSSIKKILIVRLGKIGDLVVTSFVFEVLKKKYPHLEIHLLTLTSNQEVLKYNPRLTKVFYSKKNLSLFLKLTRLRKESYDMILDFNDNPSTTSTLIFKFLTARIKAGYNFSKYERYINFKVTPIKKENSHIIERMNNFLFQLGIEADEKLVKPFFYLGSEELGEVEIELSSVNKNKHLIAVNLSAGASIRYWEIEKWNQLLHSINDAYKNCFFLLLSTEKDRMQQRQLASSLGTENCIEGKLASIQHFAAYIKSACLLITPDTSAVHIASAFGIPTLALYPNPEWNYVSWQPYHIAHRSIKSSTENVNDISVQEVFIKFKSLINEIGIT